MNTTDIKAFKVQRNNLGVCLAVIIELGLTVDEATIDNTDINWCIVMLQNACKWEFLSEAMQMAQIEIKRLESSEPI